jgi:hypothetical protein
VAPAMFLRPMAPSISKVIDRVNGAQPARVELQRNVPSPNGEPKRPSPGLRP